MGAPSISGGKTAIAYKPAQPVGKAWKNTVNIKNGKNAGKTMEMLNVVLDKGIVLTDIDERCKIAFWQNNKREGKKDADYRVTIQLPA